MEETAKSQTQHLMLDNLSVKPTVARRLSPAVACRCHALPVAEENGLITVAMANPDDAAAREMVKTALGLPSRVVRCDAVAIDTLMAEIWPEILRCSPRVLVCAHACPNADGVLTFAENLGCLLNAHVTAFEPLVDNDADCRALSRLAERSGYDLVILGQPDQPLGQRLISGPLYHKAIARINCSLLLACEPRWPLRRFLLVVRGEEIDNVAVDWVVRLARPSNAAVTVLAVVPPVPGMYGGFACMQQGLDALLTTDTTLGRQIRRMAQWLVEWELEGTLRLRQGTPDEQIRRETRGGDYDLVVIAARPHSRARRWLLGERVKSLLRCINQPLLIAKPITA
jgi:nucleotide-binding universal stress UspA family protein